VENCDSNTLPMHQTFPNYQLKCTYESVIL